MTIFGKNLTKFRTLWPVREGLFSVSRNLDHTFANFYDIVRNFIIVNGQMYNN